MKKEHSSLLSAFSPAQPCRCWALTGRHCGKQIAHNAMAKVAMPIQRWDKMLKAKDLTDPAVQASFTDAKAHNQLRKVSKKTAKPP